MKPADRRRFAETDEIGCLVLGLDSYDPRRRLPFAHEIVTGPVQRSGPTNVRGRDRGAVPQGQGTHRGIPSILPSDAVSPNRLVVSGSSAFPVCSSGIQGPTCRVSPPALRGAGRGTRSP